jgi:hypothetical protein
MEQPIAGTWKHRRFQITYNNSVHKYLPNIPQHYYNIFKMKEVGIYI